MHILRHGNLRSIPEAEQTMGMPSTTPRYWTAEDAWALPDDPRHRYEAVDGELLVTPAPRELHQIAVASYLCSCTNFVSRVQGGER
ncbi:MAG: hypothetical protein IT353_08635 [Gemmatimonadaceae bacterium]|nr:hypothetical protein [Gemmatimonadaceae bacterium]